ncbi:MAG: WYL domain-containing protein [Actinomycetota bacterium]
MEPLERLLNLVALLLEARTPLTFEQIRGTLSDAYGQQDKDSAKRMFERDKDTLRDYGIPLELVATDIWEVEQGYTIPKEKYYLPEIAFTPEELAALFVAAQTGGGSDPAEQAVRKLLYGADGGVMAGLTGGPLASGTPGSLLLAAADAAQRRRRVGFGYRTSRGSAHHRDMDAYAMLCRGGHWYLVGLDRERDAVRAFRLTRFTTDIADAGEGSEPAPTFRAADHVQAGPWGVGEPSASATVAFAPEIVWWATAGLAGTPTREPGPDGWTEVTLPMADVADLAGWVLQFGPDARVVEPEELRDEVIARLEAIRAG